MIEETKVDQIEESDELLSEEGKDELKEAIEEQLKKVQTQNMLLGAQVSCSVILDKIKSFEAKAGKRTLNDHRRLVKDLKAFCEVGLSRKVNPDGTTSPIEEDNTKLMEE